MSRQVSLPSVWCKISRKNTAFTPKMRSCQPIHPSRMKRNIRFHNLQWHKSNLCGMIVKQARQVATCHCIHRGEQHIHLDRVVCWSQPAKQTIPLHPHPQNWSENLSVYSASKQHCCWTSECKVPLPQVWPKAHPLRHRSKTIEFWQDRSQNVCRRGCVTSENILVGRQ